MSKKIIGKCECCGADLIEWTHGLTKGLLRALERFSRFGDGFHNPADPRLKLNHNQLANWQKLRYWKLIEGDEVNPKSGEWRITTLGWLFLANELKTHKKVVTFRAVVQRYEGDLVSVVQVTDGWWLRPDYIREARPHE